MLARTHDWYEGHVGPPPQLQPCALLQVSLRKMSHATHALLSVDRQVGNVMSRHAMCEQHLSFALQPRHDSDVEHAPREGVAPAPHVHVGLGPMAPEHAAHARPAAPQLP